MPRFTEAELADPVFHRDSSKGCPGCGAHWKEDSFAGQVMVHHVDCEFLKQLVARDRRVERAGR